MLNKFQEKLFVEYFLKKYLTETESKTESKCNVWKCSKTANTKECVTTSSRQLNLRFQLLIDVKGELSVIKIDRIRVISLTGKTLFRNDQTIPSRFGNENKINVSSNRRIHGNDSLRTLVTVCVYSPVSQASCTQS